MEHLDNRKSSCSKLKKDEGTLDKIRFVYVTVSDHDKFNVRVENNGWKSFANSRGRFLLEDIDDEDLKELDEDENVVEFTEISDVPKLLVDKLTEIIIS